MADNLNVTTCECSHMTDPALDSHVSEATWYFSGEYLEPSVKMARSPFLIGAK